MSKKDYYDVLGVDRSADNASLKKAYRVQAMKYHPDRNKEADAEDKFKEASEAYQILSDSKKRAQYDQYGHQAFAGGGGPSFHDMGDIFSSFGDIFGDIFSGAGASSSHHARRGGHGARATRPRQGADLRYYLDVTLEEVLKGASKDIEFEVEGPCKTCNEKGYPASHPPKVCSTCHGTGQVVSRQGFFQMATTCGTCQGQGQVMNKKCSDCRGRKRIIHTKSLSLKIPKTATEDQNLRLSREGEPGYNGGPDGDLYVKLRFQPHKNFKRKGSCDLVGKVKLSYLQAILGTEMKVSTLEGKVSLKVPSGTQPLQMLKVQGQGLYKRSSSRGDLYFEVQVEIPSKISSEEKKVLKKLVQVSGLKDSKLGSGNKNFLGL